MTHLRRYGWIPILALVGLVVNTPSREAIAQGMPPILIYGSDSGTFRPIAVGADGGFDGVDVEGQSLTDILSVLNQIDADTDTLSALAPDCDSTAAISISSSGNNEIVPLASGEVIKVCNVVLISRGTVEVQPIYGTGSACATGETNLSGPLSLKVDGTQPPGFSGGNAGGTFFTTAGQAFCIELSAAIQVDGWASYVQYTP